MDDLVQPAGSRTRLRDFFSEVLSSRYFPLIAGVIAVVLTLPSLGVGLIGDDWHHRVFFTDPDSPASLLAEPWDLYNFMNTKPGIVREAIEIGIFPWWTHPEAAGGFLRPVTSITIWVDYLLWPDLPWLMHLQSVLWHGAAAIAVSVLFRRLLGQTWVAGLAGLLYAIDDAYAMPVGMLANRNAVLMIFFGAMTLICHDRWRRGGWKAGSFLGIVFLVMSLLSNEGGVAACAYLGGYAIFIESGKLSKRFASLLPYIAVVVVWRIAWSSLGYGVEHLGMYIDPMAEPLRYIKAVIERVPLFVLGEFALPPSEVHVLVYPQVYKALRYSGIVLCVILAVMFSVMIRKDRTSRFFAFGVVVSLLPICATMPSDRLLYFVGIGAMGLIAQFLGMVFGGKFEMPRLRSYRVGAVILGGIFVFVHLIVSPVSMAVHSSMPIGPKELFASISPSESLDAGVEQQDLILVNPMDSLMCQFAPIRWAGRGEPLPRRMRILVSSIGAPVKVFRRDDKTIVVRPESGFMSSRMDWIFRSPEERFAVGDKVELDGMTAEIIELCEKCGNPAAVAFGFDAVLEDESLRWVKWERGEFVEFIPPAVGEEVTIYSDFGAVIRDYLKSIMPF